MLWVSIFTRIIFVISPKNSSPRKANAVLLDTKTSVFTPLPVWKSPFPAARKDPLT